MPVVQLAASQLSVHYTDSGAQAALPNPVLLLHANPGSSEDFAGIRAQLEEKGYRVIALDWPGYGQSPAPSPAQIAKAAFLFFEVLREFVAVLNLPACIIIGNSVGGNAAVRLAHDRPERVARLVLVSPGGFTPHNVVTRNLCWFMSTRLAPSPSMFARIYLGHHGAPVVKAMLQRARTEQSHGPALALNRAVWGSFALPEHDVRGLARTLQLPVLLVFGKHDPVIPPSKDGAEARKSFGTNAKFVVMDSGHAPFAEIPAEFLKELDAFLQAA